MAGTILDRYPDPEFERDAFDHLGDYGSGSFELARADGLNEEAAPYRNPRNAVFHEQLSRWIAEKRAKRKETPVMTENTPAIDKPSSVYRPIADQYEIRVLEIHPGDYNDPIKTSLVHCTVEFQYERVLMVPNTEGPYFGLKTKHVLPMDLERPVFYTALSYTWGTGGFDAKIECDGQPLPITISLDTALRHFRRTGHAIVMWIDQICIDQTNAEEKKQQIPLMSKIYSRALNTAIWLGEGIALSPCNDPAATNDSEDMALAFDLLRQIRITLQFHSSTALTTGDLPQLLLPSAASPSWRHLRALFARPWFQRLWVIQEAILSDNPWMVCGSTSTATTTTTTTTSSSSSSSSSSSPSRLTTMPFEEFSNACNTLILSGLHRLLLSPRHSAAQDDADGCRTALDLSFQREQYMQAQHPLRLVDALVFTRYARCYFAHDKVYGLLGVCGGEALDIRVDYARGAGELFREVAVGFVREAAEEAARAERKAQGGRGVRAARFSVFDVLICVDHEPEAEALPSWCPDWARARVTDALGHSTSTLAFYEAGGEGDPELEINGGGRELVLKGKVVDVVGDLSAPFEEPHLGLPPAEDRANDMLVCLEFVGKRYACRGKCVCAEPCKYVSGCKIFEAFWQTLVAGKDESGKQRCPQSWSIIFSLLLDSATGAKYSLPDQEYDKRQELPDGHRGKLKVAHLGNWGLPHPPTERPDVQISPSIPEHHRKGRKNQKETKKQPGEVGQRKLAKTFQDVQKAVRHAMRNRRFGTTDKKYFGLFPNHARAGDVVCVFPGCHVPFLLREKGGSGTYQLVGECYVHGLMAGEAMGMESISMDVVRLM